MSTFRIAGIDFELLPTLVIFGIVVAISVVGGLATDTSSVWYTSLDRPSWQPPSWLFGPVWTTIYLLLAASCAIVWHVAPADQRMWLMTVYAINGALNLAWSFIFFRGHAPALAGIDILLLLATIVLLVVRAWPHSPAASLMLVPYLLWVSFASVLNWAIAIRN